MRKYSMIPFCILIAGVSMGQVTLNTKEITVFAGSDLQLLKARISDKVTGNPVKGIRGYVIVPGEQFQMRTSISDDNGNLFFPMTGMEGPRHLIFETNTQKDSNYIFSLNKPILQRYPAEPLEKNADNAMDDSLVFYGKPDKRYLLDDYVRFPTLEEVFREYVLEVRISKIRNEYHFAVINTPFRLYFNEEPLILLDGVPVFDYKKLMAIDPLKIKKMEVVARKYYYGSLVCNGIVSLFSYDGDLGGYTLHPNALLMEYEGPASSK
jgi:hypothetical protein